MIKRMNLLSVVPRLMDLIFRCTWRKERIRFSSTYLLHLKFAATFHCEVKDLVDMEEITEDRKQKPTWQFDLREKECLKDRMVKATLDKKLCQCLGVMVRSGSRRTRSRDQDSKHR